MAQGLFTYKEPNRSSSPGLGRHQKSPLVCSVPPAAPCLATGRRVLVCGVRPGVLGHPRPSATARVSVTCRSMPSSRVFCVSTPRVAGLRNPQPALYRHRHAPGPCNVPPRLGRHAAPPTRPPTTPRVPPLRPSPGRPGSGPPPVGSVCKMLFSARGLARIRHKSGLQVVAARLQKAATGRTGNSSSYTHPEAPWRIAAPATTGTPSPAPDQRPSPVRG